MSVDSPKKKKKKDECQRFVIIRSKCIMIISHMVKIKCMFFKQRIHMADQSFLIFIENLFKRKKGVYIYMRVI